MISTFVVIMVSIVFGMWLERRIRHRKSGWLVFGPDGHGNVALRISNDWKDVEDFKLHHSGYMVVKVYAGDDYRQRQVVK